MLFKFKVRRKRKSFFQDFWIRDCRKIIEPSFLVEFIVAVQAPHSMKIDKLPRLDGNFITPSVFIIVKLDEAVFHHGFFDYIPQIVFNFERVHFKEHNQFFKFCHVQFFVSVNLVFKAFVDFNCLVVDVRILLHNQG